jgi:hypothetical protein
VNAHPIEGARRQVGYVAVPDVTRDLREVEAVDLLAGVAWIIEADFNPRRDLGINGEVHPLPVERGAARIGSA